MSLFRSAIATARNSSGHGGTSGSAGPIRFSIARQATRSFASETPKPVQQAQQAASQAAASGSSNLPLILGLGGVGGLGVYYYLGGFQGEVKKPELPKALSPGALNKNEFKEFTLKEVKPYNHDSSTFVFELPDNLSSGMKVASAVVVKGVGEGVKDKEGKPVIRPYTPVTSPDTQGHIDLLVKKYADGAMTNHIHNLKPGDKLAFKGPIDKYEYKANTLESIACIAGGSGITPMWQLLQEISRNPSDKTKVTLIYTNKSEKDILLREEFDKMAKDSRFNIVYGLDKKPSSFQGQAFEGYVTPEILSQHLPAPALADKIKIFVCGPPPQVEAISGGKGPKGSQGELKGLLADQGYQPDQVYKF